MVCGLLGIPTDLAPQVLAAVNAGSLAEPGVGVDTAEARPNYLEFLSRWSSAAAPTRPGTRCRVVDGLLGYRLPDGSALSDVEAATQMLCIFIGGTETVPKIVAHGLWELSQRPDQLAAVRADPATNVPIAREEMIRFCAPAQWFARTARKPFSIHGKTIRARPAHHHPAGVGQPRRAGIPGARRVHLEPAHPSFAGVRPWPALLHRLPPGQAGNRCAADRMASAGAGLRDPKRRRHPAAVQLPVGMEQDPGGGLTCGPTGSSPRICSSGHRSLTSRPSCLADGQVLLRFLAAGVCGSDLPAFRGARGRLPGDDGQSAAEKDGFPIHEVAGEVIASRHPDHRPGDRVVGWASGFDGLMERVVSDGNGLAPYDPALTPAQAIGLQPLACVLYACEQLPDLAGRHVAIIGQGSIGLLFSYVAKAAGARRVTGVDPVDRGSLATTFGVDDAVRATSDRWVSQLAAADRADVVIEAVGHQVATLGHAIEAAAPGGTIFYFGVADDDAYPISMRLMLRNNLTLKSGVTLDRRRVLELAGKFAAEHPELLGTYLTHTFGVDDVQGAFELACRPDPERIKIAIAE